MTWAVYDGVVQLCCPAVLLGWKTPVGGEVDPRGAWRGTRTMFKDGSTKLGFTTDWFSETHRWRDGPAKGRTG